MNLNDQNIDELMFQLLEGEIQGEERTRLLDAINADKNYSKQWQAWQQTILNPNSELIVMNSAGLKKGKKRLVALWWKYSAAAVIIIAIAFTIYYVRDTQKTEMVHSESPVNPKLQIIKVPAIEPNNPRRKPKDSVPSFKQKVQMMVKGSQKGMLPEERFIQPIPVKQIDPEFIAEKPLKDEGIKVPEKLKNYAPEPVVLAKKEEVKNLYEDNGVIMTVQSGNKNERLPSITQKYENKKNLLSRIFSKPAFKVVNDSNAYTKKKLIIENKEYKIIAGF